VVMLIVVSMKWYGLRSSIALPLSRLSGQRRDSAAW
jgi:hypothetical protein